MDCGWATYNPTVIKTWPIVDAEVIKSQVNATRGTTRNGFPVTRYEAEIVFRYTVGGKEYTSRSTPGYMTSRYSIMKRIVEAYAPGTHHPIRYNPEYPNIIIFNAGYNFGFFMLPLMFGGGRPLRPIRCLGQRALGDVDRYRKTKVHFVDCLIATAAKAEDMPVATFDEDFRKFGDVRIENA